MVLWINAIILTGIWIILTLVISPIALRAIWQYALGDGKEADRTTNRPDTPD
jgi:hypothetical protein